VLAILINAFVTELLCERFEFSFFIDDLEPEVLRWLDENGLNRRAVLLKDWLLPAIIGFICITAIASALTIPIIITPVIIVIISAATPITATTTTTIWW
jgi:hypothetical protein